MYQTTVLIISFFKETCTLYTLTYVEMFLTKISKLPRDVSKTTAPTRQTDADQTFRHWLPEVTISVLFSENCESEIELSSSQAPRS